MLKLLKLIIKVKFIYGEIEKTDIVIFDCEGKDAIESLFSKKKYKVLSVRYEKISIIYLNLKIFKFIIKNLFKFSLKQLYLIGIIKCFAPKLIITQIPHSLDFSLISKYCEKEFNFVAIQHGHHDIYSLEKKLKEKIYIPNFFCFGKYEEDLYKKNNFNIKNYIPVGSLRASLSKEYLDNKNKNDKLKIQYDICLISEYSPSKEKLFPGKDSLQFIPSYPEHVGKIAYFCHKLRDEENLSLIFCGDSEPNSVYQNIENKFYSKFLKNINFNILQENRNTFPTYVNLLKSKIVIGGYSTVLREALGLGKKILSCNFTDNPTLDFPLDEICLFKNGDYKEFKNIVLKILSMKEDEYFKKINFKKEFIMKDCYQTSKLIKEKLNKYIN